MDRIIKLTDGLFGRQRSLLMRGKASVRGERVLYSLFGAYGIKGSIFYIILCEYCGEWAECPLYCSEMQAKTVFSMLIRGRVTPCAFMSVIEDLVPVGWLAQMEEYT